MKTFWFREETYTIIRPKPQPENDDDNPLFGCLFFVILFVVISLAIKGCGS